MPQQGKELATKPEDLSSNPRPPLGRRECLNPLKAMTGNLQKDSQWSTYRGILPSQERASDAGTSCAFSQVSLSAVHRKPLASGSCYCACCLLPYLCSSSTDSNPLGTCHCPVALCRLYEGQLLVCLHWQCELTEKVGCQVGLGAPSNKQYLRMCCGREDPIRAASMPCTKTEAPVSNVNPVPCQRTQNTIGPMEESPGMGI
uniref:LRRGT00154 n=1 Tax=Rattus norvegicus TaxID=10116 RepID=Q6QI54_RAT|nr:LRRGT00154 [Rattus norvegicus]|eukprot:NP_001041409.1 uncharacterized protein LOC499544 [Rattus norvegicus]